MNLDLGTSLWAQVRITWDELQEHWLKLPHASSLPLPVPEGTLDLDVFVDVSGGTSSTSAPQFRLRLEADCEINPEGRSLLGFTFGRSCRFTFTTGFAAASALEPQQGVRLDGKLTLELQAKLPALPDSELVRVDTGDAEGWTTFRLEAEVLAGAGGGVKLRAEVLKPFSLGFQLPGLIQPEPPLRLALERIGGELSFLDGKLRGALVAEGNFTFTPQLAGLQVPLADYLQPLVRDLSLAGSAKFILSLSQSQEEHESALEGSGEAASTADAIIRASVLLADDNPEFFLCVTFRDADFTIHPFYVIRRAVSSAQPVSEDATGQVGLGLGLRGLCVGLGREPSFAIEMFLLAGIEVPAYLKLSRTELRVGVGRVLPGSRGKGLRIPLQLPRISRKEFGFLEGVPIDDDSRRKPGATPLDQTIYSRLKDGQKTYNQWLNLYFDVVEQFTGATPTADQLLMAWQEGDTWKVELPAGLEFDDDTPLRVVTGCVGEWKDGSLRPTGELAVVCYVKEADTWHVLMARPALQLDGFYFSLPFQNPRDIRVAGTARFVVDGPLHEISKLAVTVGLSADLIYFSVDVDGTATIEIPEFIPGYAGGSVSLAKLMFGFGYTKRSMAVAFAGELKLPEQLVDDLDTSEELGAGIRLPVQSKLAFQFDLIPLVLGKIIVPIPMFQFNWDLRQDVSPGLRDARTCEPYWDGLQLIIPGVVRTSLKRISYNPLLGLYCSSNSDFDGDLVLGDEENGLSVIADNIFWAYGMDSGMAIVLAPVASLPFADNFCLSVRLGGFRLNFNLQRPIPSFSPLAIFEVLALLADPFYEIAPRGELADTVRVSLTDAWLVLPDEVRKLFPGTEAFTHKTLEVTINLATYLKMLQRVAKALKPIGETVIAALKDPEGAAKELQQRAAELSSSDPRTIGAELLAFLPPELRKLRVDANFAGFEGTAVLVMTDGEGARGAMASRDEEPPDDSKGASETPPDWRTKPRIRSSRGAPRMYDSEQKNSNMLLGSEFVDFTEADLDAIPLPLSDSLLEPSELTPALVARLKTGKEPVSDYLRGRFSKNLVMLLDRYEGGLPSDALRRALTSELNRILKGKDSEEACIYDSGCFDDVVLGVQLQRLIERHKRQPLEGLELRRLNRALLEAAYTSELPATVGVLVGARVRVIGGQRFRFIGSLFANGAFSLVSMAKIEPLELTVAGIPVRLPFEVDGRLQLTGRASRDGIVGSILTEGYAAWDVVPGALRLTLGSPKERASFELFSDGAFAFTASASAILFNNPQCALLYATADISNTHCFVSGTMDFQFGLIAGLRLFELHATAQGRIGPQQRFRLEFAAETTGEKGGPDPSRLLGMPLTSLRGAISESEVELEARLAETSWTPWPGSTAFQPPFRIIAALLKGRLNPRKSDLPDFELEGALTLQLFDSEGPKVTGRGGFSSINGGLRAFIEGTLTWQARDWLSARVELRPDEIRISGSASLFFSLTPPNTGAIQLSQLVVSVDLSGQFTLNALGMLTSAKGLRARCMLALSFPSASQQPLPLAVAELTAPDWTASTATGPFEVTLLRVGAFLPPAIQFDVPDPQVTSTTTLPGGVGWGSSQAGFSLPVPKAEKIAGQWAITGVETHTFMSGTATPSFTPGTLTIPATLDLARTKKLSPPNLLTKPFTVSLCLDVSGKRFALKISP